MLPLAYLPPDPRVSFGRRVRRACLMLVGALLLVAQYHIRAGDQLWTALEPLMAIER